MNDKAIGYIRVSTEEQASADRYGLDAQKEIIYQYARDNGYEIALWKIDKVSGASDERPALKEVLELTNPPYQAVIVFKNDRLARDTKLYFYYLYLLEKRGLKLISVKENFPEGNEFANVYRAMLQFVAEQERKNIAMRTGVAKNLKASCGGYACGRPPFGYKAEHGKLVIVDSEREVVELIFELRAKGKTMWGICEELHDRGYRTRKGAGWYQPGSIKIILDNKHFYEGFYRYKGGKWVLGAHEPILKIDYVREQEV